jgi:ppGpp synthetase/RelA/SpoT-type nucleotidyltranferase
MVDIEEIIRRRFPEDLVDPTAFEEYFNELLDDVRGPAWLVVSAIRERLKLARRQAEAAEAIERDRWVLFGDAESTKSAASARSKLARDLEHEQRDDVLNGARMTRDALRERLLAFSDLARVRIVCTLNQDVQLALDNLIQEDRLLGDYELRGEIKDFVFEPERRGVLKGHRARQFAVTVAGEGCQFGFEVQLMTTLQHSWDRRNHPLYEWTREGGDLPDELRVNDFACSEALHLVDQQSERNWESYLELRRRGR